MLVREIAGRGRGVIAQQALPRGSVLLSCSPIAQVVKKPATDGAASCSHCLGPLPPNTTRGTCCAACALSRERAGGALLDRCDLGKLHDEHREYGRKFPLFAAGLLANLLAGLARDRKPPDAWQHAMALCFTDLPEEAAPVLAEEYAALTSAFVDAGVTTRASLDLLLPLTTYERLLGAAQLNAFELTTSRGLVLSCLLPGVASMFNHDCDPSVHVACDTNHEVAFVAARDMQAGDELCISYVDTSLPFEERRRALQQQYGFDIG